MEDLWRATQVPDLHERWDLRFTDIEYLPRPDPARPQRFRYATRIGFGLTIEGEGESVGQKDRDGERTSALRFWSNDARSLNPRRLRLLAVRTGRGRHPVPHLVRLPHAFRE